MKSFNTFTRFVSLSEAHGFPVITAITLIGGGAVCREELVIDSLKQE